MNNHNEVEKPPCRCAAGYTLIELIAAIGILVIVIGLFSTLLNSIRNLELIYGMETKSIVVLNNTIERIKAERSWNLEKANRILSNEFARSDLNSQNGLHPECLVESNRINLAIIKINGIPLAKVELLK